MPTPERQHHKRSPSPASPGDKTTAMITLGVFGAAVVGVLGLAYGAKYVKPPKPPPPSAAGELEFARNALREADMLYREHNYAGARRQAAAVHRMLEFEPNKTPQMAKLIRAARRLEAEALHMSRQR